MSDADRAAFAVLANGREEPPWGPQAEYLVPLIADAHARELAVALFDLAELGDADAAPGYWFAPGDLLGVAGIFAVPPVAYDRHLDGTADDHRRRLRLAERRRVVNPPAVQALMADKLETNRILRAAGVAVPAEVVGGSRRRPTVDKPRYGRRGRGLEVRRRRRARRLRGWPTGDREALVSEEYIEPMGFTGAHPHVKVHVQREGADLAAVGAAARYWPEPFTGTGDLSHAAPVVDYEDRFDLGLPAGWLTESTGTLAVRAVEAVEASVESVHEAGVDIIVGPRGDLTVIEVNSKPGRSSYRLIADDPDRPASVRREARDGEAAARRRLIDEMVRHLDPRGT